MFRSLENRPLTARDYAMIIMERRKIFLFILGLFLLAGLLVFLFAPKTYTTQVTFNIERPEYGIGEVRMKGFYWGGIKPRDFATQVKLLRSVAMFEDAVRTAGLTAKDARNMRIDVYIPEKSENIVTLYVYGPDQIKIVRLANAYVEELIANSFRYRKKLLLSQKEWLEQEIRESAKNVQLTKRALTAFESENPQISKDIALLKDLENKQLEIEEMLRNLTIRYGEKYPKVVSLRETLTAIQKEIASLRKGEEKNRVWIQQYEQLKRETEASEKFYQDLMTISQGLNAASDFTITNIQVIDEARIPSTPGSNVSIFQIFLLLGLAASSGTCLLLEFLDTTFDKPREVEKYLKMPLIGHIPPIPHQKKSGRISSIPIYALRDTNSIISETFRGVKVALKFMATGKSPLKTLLVTSSIEGEGRTFTASGLAIAFARSGKRTLLLGGDLHKSDISEEFMVKSGGRKLPHTLIDIFLGKIKLEDAIFESDFQDLWVLGDTAPEPEAAEILSMEQFSSLIESLKERFDIIVVDSPSIRSSLDAQILARNCDGILLVIGANRARLEDINDALAHFENKSMIIGAVLNSVASKKDFDYYAIRAIKSVRDLISWIKKLRARK